MYVIRIHMCVLSDEMKIELKCDNYKVLSNWRRWDIFSADFKQEKNNYVDFNIQNPTSNQICYL